MGGNALSEPGRLSWSPKQALWEASGFLSLQFFLLYLCLVAFLPASKEDIQGVSGIHSHPHPDCEGRGHCMQDQREDLDTSVNKPQVHSMVPFKGGTVSSLSKGPKSLKPSNVTLWGTRTHCIGL